MGFASTVFFHGGSICSVRISILLSLLPVVIIGLGAKHIFDCPKQPMVPMYLLVGGVACLCLQICPIFYCRPSDGSPILPCRILNSLLLLFCSIWFITGSVFVYMAYQPNYESRHSVEYCERILYQVAFWITNAIYISIPLLLLCHCCKTCWENRSQNLCSISTLC
ncbi:transmembrane protein 272-like [Salminus brasiliensis]|uniref:transmembrane protein 272-like n=1 Tax=Salminus brasiliensis TaxID=930266 RepID=UPI003B836BA5